MQPILEQISADNQLSFSIKQDKLVQFDTPWHYHPEIELVLIERSNGQRFVGDSIANFEDHDLVLLGANLPHHWKNSPETEKASAIVCHFHINAFGEEFFHLPEMALIKQLIQKASYGLQITGETNIIIRERMQSMLKMEGARRLNMLLHILDVLSISEEVETLASASFAQSFSNDRERLSLVYEYVSAHYQENIRLEDIAAHIHMTKTSFCRYFKQQTKKPFSNFLNEFRIGYAKRLLRSKDTSVADIGYTCGFNQASYFNRQFKEITGMTPLAFQRSQD